MGVPTDDGPDGSSIKPVSSLLAKFENMNKGTADAPPSTAPPPGRTVSPSPPKPDRLRDAPTPTTSSAAASKEPPPVPNTRPKPKDKLNIGLHVPASGPGPSPSPLNGITSPNRPLLPPPISPRPIHPPAVLVEPPLSPPKSGGVDVAVGERPIFLQQTTDSMPKPVSPSGPKPFRIPSRPHTPTPVLDPRRSPRLVASQPPSPPPPRRSAELRRDREAREVGKPLPPPINRAEKPLIPARASYFAEGAQASEWKSRFAGEKPLVSPFGHPADANGGGLPDEDVEEARPMLPARPRPQQAQAEQPFQAQPPVRQQTIQMSFEPPPLHHSIATKRKEREDVNGSARGIISPQQTGDLRPSLPARPQSVAILPGNNAATMLPPPRPPRPAVIGASPPTEAVLTSQKRVVSSPSTSQLSPPPTRTHGRSMTVDRTSSRVPSEFRVPAAHIPATHVATHIGGLGSIADARSIPESPSISSRGESMVPAVTAFPDATQTNRGTPFIGKGVHEIATKYDSRVFDVCGEMVCTTGTLTRVWSLLDGELLMSLAMGEGIKGTSVAFKPGANVDEEGQRVWIGNNFGELMEADIATQSIIASKPQVHSRLEVIKIHRHFNELWTLDESGTLHVWEPDDGGTPNLNNGPTQSYRVPRGHMFSIVVGDELWHATGKEIRVFLPTPEGKTQFQVLMRPLCQDSAGEVTSGTLLSSSPEKVFFGHNDGKVSIYSRTDYSCLGVVSVSSYKINSLAGVGKDLWAGYNNGRISVFDMGQTPWAVKKEWQAHDNPVVKLIADHSSFYKLDRYHVVSLGADNMVRAWDGLLQDGWLEGEMKRKDAEYCDFKKLKALVLTWNAGASTPHSLRYSDSDSTFIQDLLQSSDSPDILVFGFQELVDLEDKTATAKRFLKPKKKEGSDQERMSHQYRDWRDFLQRSLDDHMAGDLYHLLHTAPLVGLFTCIFVKADLRDRISNLSSAEVKCGMGGLYGNKGAIAIRFLVDDTSLCFINCHLAAGQSAANSRHNDVATILEASVFPGERDAAQRLDLFVGGGDGTMILDHELCVLNGDLNYRIDTMSRDTVVAAVKVGNLTKLLERDQLNVARRRKAGFHLRAFDEMTIAFAPTYKYDVGTDVYDSSEKKRSPAWCDRLLHRSGGGHRERLAQLDYRRHEVRVSDHRPVSGRFRFTVKRINQKRRAVAWMECQQVWEDLKEEEAAREKFYYLTHIIGYDDDTAEGILRDRATARSHR